MIDIYRVDQQDKTKARQYLVPLARLNWDEDMVKVKEYLELNLAHFREKNDSAEGVTLHQQQGACQFIKQFIDVIENANETMEALSRVNRQQSSPFSTGTGIHPDI